MKKIICILLLCLTLTGCFNSNFMTVEYREISSTKIQYTYTITKNKKIDTWDVTISGTKVEFYINDELYSEKTPMAGATSTSLKMTDFELEKGDVCKLVVIGSHYKPSTYGTKINGETLQLTFS